MKSIIKEFTASSAEIHDIVNRIEQVCDGVDIVHLEIALIAIALELQYPEISTEERVEGVQDVSRYISLWLDTKIDKDNLTVN